jgi:hypothetical protein
VPSPSLTNIDLLALLTNGSVDRVLSDFDGNTTSYNVAAATLSGGFYIPKADSLVIPNPAGKKCLINMVYSYDGGTTYYPQKYRLYQPGNPVPDGALGAVAGASVDANNITFYFTHYYGFTLNFQLFWILDNIL